jgi:3-methyl-2-oxobutanoate hydroxymethyltransferase
MSHLTIPQLQQQKIQGKKITIVTAYDALFTKIVEQAGLEVILVGDSLGMVVQGKPNTLSVTMEEMLYHTRMVAQAAKQALVIGDMPFLSYQVSVEEALRNAGRFLQAGAGAVKLEGGLSVVDRVEAMIRCGIPVMGHVGMTPQSVNQSGGYRVRGKDGAEAQKILEEAKALEAAGVFAGIGAGQGCDGQVLVLYDLLGLFDDFVPKFVKPYGHLKADALQALKRYKEEVECGKFPSDAESYQ